MRHKIEEVLKIHVILDQTHSVKGAGGEAVMILFHGTFTCSLGTGKVLPGGVMIKIYGNPGHNSYENLHC